MLAPPRLKAVTGLQEAADLFRELGFTANALPIDASELHIGDYPNSLALKRGRGRARGYGVFITEMEDRPRSLKPLGIRLLRHFHDRPLGVVGIKGGDGRWERFIIIRPQWIPGAIGAARLSKLEVDTGSPTHHDGLVLSSIAWSGDDQEAHARIDRALDAEAVTKRFYLGLAEHHERLIEAVRTAADEDPAVLVGIKEAGGHERVALRILTQILFCWFLQRKRLLAGDPEYLRTRFLRHRGRYYETELEPLFYETLALPPERRGKNAPGPEVPFLNGGLFVRHYGDVSLPLPDELFDLEEGLLGFLEGWTFTVAEGVPEESEVAVDPEMLGKVFENLISDEEEKKQGTVYTPRAVVHFMCREALVPWLQDKVGVTEEWARRLLVDDAAFDLHAEAEGSEATLELAEDLDHELAGLTVLDPGVGSGAFLLGMLAEIVRLRALAFEAVKGKAPSTDETIAWKLHAIERTLSGVDINPTAIELCRLRLWLALVVDLPEGETPHPLPNLEHRTIVANSLSDFVNGIPVQNTREGVGGLEDAAVSSDAVVELRHAYFAATDPKQKETIRADLERYENELIEEIFTRALSQGDQDEESLQQLAELASRFRSHDREFPIFAPGFHAPDVWLQGGWDVTIMNPPYLGKTEVAKHIDRLQREDYRRHFGELNDLMILFARRARQLTRPGGIVSMIFNDSIFTSSDATDLRWIMFEENEVLVCARTRCFEGKAVNGGVVVARLSRSEDPSHLRWVEGYKKSPGDFASASDPLEFEAEVGRKAAAGSMEVFSAPGSAYSVLPHRPLYRPSSEAVSLLDRFTSVERWGTIGTREGWDRLSNTSALTREIEGLREAGWYDSLEPGQWVPLGYVIEGGLGLGTRDDRFFLGAIEGTQAAEDHLSNQERLEGLLESEPPMLRKYGRLRARGLDRENALLELWSDMGNDAVLSKLWPKGAGFRVAKESQVRREPLSDGDRREGIASGPYWVPFEKGDRSQPVTDEEGKVTYLGARWTRENPVVIDWSKDAVALLRKRARGPASRRKPYFRNEDLWFSAGITWNRTARYFRCRRAPETAIFGDKTPLIRPTVEWMDADALLALLNSPTVDFVLRTFLGSLMQIEIGDVRRIPVPVLSVDQNDTLTQLAEKAVTERLRTHDGTSRLESIETELDAVVRDLYRVPHSATLWVQR